MKKPMNHTTVDLTSFPLYSCSDSLQNPTTANFFHHTTQNFSFFPVHWIITMFGLKRRHPIWKFASFNLFCLHLAFFKWKHILNISSSSYYLHPWEGEMRLLLSYKKKSWMLCLFSCLVLKFVFLSMHFSPYWCLHLSKRPK